VPHTPNFLWGSVESPNFMRLCSKKAEHATMGAPRTGIRVSDPFLVRCGIPLRSTCHRSALVDTRSLDASLRRTVEARGIPHLALIFSRPGIAGTHEISEGHSGLGRNVLGFYCFDFRIEPVAPQQIGQVLGKSGFRHHHVTTRFHGLRLQVALQVGKKTDD
jgi:hypothetical protein